jgi:hypothetical protein
MAVASQTVTGVGVEHAGAEEAGAEQDVENVKHVGNSRVSNAAACGRTSRCTLSKPCGIANRWRAEGFYI